MADTDKSAEPTEQEVNKVLYEGKDIKVVFSSISNGILGPQINIYLENNSKQNITVQVRDCSVNGFMLQPVFSSNVAAGKKANDSIKFLSTDLEKNNITNINTIELSLTIFKTETMGNIVDTDPVTITLNGDSNSASSSQTPGQVLYDKNGIKIMYKSLTDDSTFGPEINVYVENNSKKNITVQVRDCSVNGFMINPMFSCEVVSGKKANDSIKFLGDDLKKNNITDINKVELSLNIFETKNFSDITKTNPITINIKQ